MEHTGEKSREGGQLHQLLHINVEITALNYLEHLKWLYSTKVSLDTSASVAFSQRLVLATLY